VKVRVGMRVVMLPATAAAARPRGAAPSTLLHTHNAPAIYFTSYTFMGCW
jgi:hypothetical protein